MRKHAALQNGFVGFLALGAIALVWNATGLVPDPVDKAVTVNELTWHEDGLPQEMYDHVAEYGYYPDTDLVNLDDATSQERHGRVGCWEAQADTTLVMCPDGYVAES